MIHHCGMNKLVVYLLEEQSETLENERKKRQIVFIQIILNDTHFYYKISWFMEETFCAKKVSIPWETMCTCQPDRILHHELSPDEQKKETSKTKITRELQIH